MQGWPSHRAVAWVSSSTWRWWASTGPTSVSSATRPTRSPATSNSTSGAVLFKIPLSRAFCFFTPPHHQPCDIILIFASGLGWAAIVFFEISPRPSVARFHLSEGTHVFSSLLPNLFGSKANTYFPVRKASCADFCLSSVYFE